MSWRSDELETRCGRESHHPAEGALWTPDWVGDQTSRKQDVVERTALSRKLGPRASGWAALENEKDTTLMAITVGVNILQFCSVCNSLSHATFQIKWEVHIFLKKSSLVFIIIVLLCSVYMHIHDGDYATWELCLIGLVPLFNSISTIVGYLILKSSF